MAFFRCNGLICSALSETTHFREVAQSEIAFFKRLVFNVLSETEHFYS
nr:MAG TPA: hypothetical protein [Caudoviricetes sp.]